jgi:hypothetical protein
MIHCPNPWLLATAKPLASAIDVGGNSCQDE